MPCSIVAPIVVSAKVLATLQDGFAIVRGELKVDGPVSVRWVSGRRKPQDFIWTSATSWVPYDVDVRGAEDEHIHGYAGLSVPGRCGPNTVSDRKHWRTYHNRQDLADWVAVNF